MANLKLNFEIAQKIENDENLKNRVDTEKVECEIEVVKILFFGKF